MINFNKLIKEERMSNYNWNDKEDRARFAQDHTKEMQIKYRDEIYAGIRNTIIFDQKSLSIQKEKM